MENSGECAVCGVEAIQSCSACKSIKYCGVEHQRKHWKIHKLECRSFSVSTDKKVGRFLLATRNIKANTVIFTENPLIIAPKWYLSEKEEYNPIVPCVGCYTAVRVGIHGCPSCRWPACSEDCAGLNNPKLHAVECPLLALGNGPKSSDLGSIMDYYRTDALIVLKCLMLQRRAPKKWQEIMNLQSHEHERVESELHLDAEKRIVSYLLNNFLYPLKSLEAQSSTKILEKCDPNILHKICGIIETNYMCINLPSGLELSGLYYTACMMEHSCLPNCYFSFDYNNGFKISVIAGRDIEQGEHLKIMYSNMLWGTQIRQEHLHLTKHFSCKCERCLDKTELGTYFSGLKCMGSELAPCGGIQLPADPLAQQTDWICDKCPIRMNSEEVKYLMSQMGEEVDSLLASKPSINQIESLIDKLSQFLHGNHYHLFNLKHSLIQMYGTQPGYLPEQLSDECILRKISITENLLDICNRLDPHTIRLSLYVAILLNELHSAIVEYNKRQLVKANDVEAKESVVKGFQRAHELLLRAKNILEKEFDTVAGVKLNETLNKSITNVEQLIAK